MSWLRKREVCNERNRREKVILTEGEFLRREEANKRYLMKLETPYLLRSYLHEAGRYSGEDLMQKPLEAGKISAAS